MSSILQDFSTPALVAAIEANAIAQFTSMFLHISQLEVHEEPDLIWTVANIPSTNFNYVMRLRLAPAGVDARIESTLAHYRSRHTSGIWITNPNTQPADLGTHLEAHGLTRVADLTGMAIELLALNESSPAPAGLTIERVGDVERLRQWLHPIAISFCYSDLMASVLCDLYASQGFEHDMPWRLYVGFLDGSPVSASLMLLAAGVAGIYRVATVPQVRRQGIGTALALAPLQEARSLGYHIGVLATEQMGLSIHRRLGFRAYCELGIYA
jgi:ribosomal protein S18 acetylase RimI-like enzyme